MTTQEAILLGSLLIALSLAVDDVEGFCKWYKGKFNIRKFQPAEPIGFLNWLREQEDK